MHVRILERALVDALQICELRGRGERSTKSQSTYVYVTHPSVEGVAQARSIVYKIRISDHHSKFRKEGIQSVDFFAGDYARSDGSVLDAARAVCRWAGVDLKASAVRVISEAQDAYRKGIREKEELIAQLKASTPDPGCVPIISEKRKKQTISNGGHSVGDRIAAGWRPYVATNVERWLEAKYPDQWAKAKVEELGLWKTKMIKDARKEMDQWSDEDLAKILEGVQDTTSQTSSAAS